MKEKKKKKKKENYPPPPDGIISAKGGGEFLRKSNLETRPLLKKDSAPRCWSIGYWGKYIKISLHTI
jgi:hypothetical protein